MGVNSAFQGVFIRQLAVRCSIAIVMVFSFSEVWPFGSGACVERARGSAVTPGRDREMEIVPGHTSPGRDRELRVKQVNLLVRLIGHRLLMQAGDFTSRVLPVTEVREGTFVLEFENNVRFSHDSLIALADDLFPKSQFPSGYTVMVLDCMKAAIVYGFQINHTTPDLLTCQGRNEPAGCYTIEFTFPDFYQREEAVVEVTKSKEVAPSTKRYRDVESKPQVKASSATADIDKLIVELKSFKAERNDVVAERNKIERPMSYGSLISLIPTGMLVALSVTLLIGRFSKTLGSVPARNQNSDVAEESAPALPALGKFLFDVKGQRLLLGAEAISLTEKECKILELLNQNFGELIPRDTLMQKIWIDEGVITGRSLDMFVSKLRKKLSGDPELRITNVHGKGYKVEKVRESEMPGGQECKV